MRSWGFQDREDVDHWLSVPEASAVNIWFTDADWGHDRRRLLTVVTRKWLERSIADFGPSREWECWPPFLVVQDGRLEDLTRRIDDAVQRGGPLIERNSSPEPNRG